MSTVCKHGYVEGKVQGVWFRGFTRDQALQRGVEGWAKNTADGRVEVFLCGEAGAVEAVIAAMHKGPPLAQVSLVTMADSAPRDTRGFQTS